MTAVFLCEDGHEPPAAGNCGPAWRTPVAGTVSTPAGPMVCRALDAVVTRRCPGTPDGKICGLIAWMTERA